MPRENTLAECLHLVTTFHLQIKAPVCAGPPQLIPSVSPDRVHFYSQRLAQLSQEMADEAGCHQDLLLGRAALDLEELSEWLQAHFESNLIAVADALADRFYILLGDAVVTGLPLAGLFLEVHESNLTKTPLVTTGYGRGVKGPTYRPPDIARVLKQYEG